MWENFIQNYSLNLADYRRIFCSLKNSANEAIFIENKQTFLCTTLIKIIYSTGNFVTFCVLLDSCSEASFISENCFCTLYLEKNSGITLIIFSDSCIASKSGEV